MAATTVRVSLEPSEELRAALAALSDPDPAISRALRAVVLRAQALAAEEFIIRSGPPGVVDPHRVTSRTGTLRRSIGTDLGELPEAASVGSELVYARAHELGAPNRNLPARPFLAPALEKVVETGEAEAIFLRELKRAAGIT